MFTRLLVPLDGTPHAATALPAARTMARVARASSVLVRVVHASAPSEETRQAEQATSAVADELARGGLDVEVVTRHGDPASEIVAASHAVSADVVVMATGEAACSAPSPGALASVSSPRAQFPSSSPTPSASA